MKKISYLLFAGALSSMVLFNSCGKDEEEEDVVVDDCSTLTFPANTGSAAVKILNYSATSGNFTTISASANDVLSFAVEVTKGTNRPQDFTIYQSDCENSLGTKVGDELDLRNTGDAQVKQFTFTVPTGYSTLYLNIEVDESGSTYTYKRIKLNISGSGIIDTWTAELGGNSNTDLASRMSSGTGQTYFACDAAANMEFIDITYAVNTSNPYPSYICSNPARFLAPVSLTNANPAGCDDNETLSTAGGSATYFKVYSGNTSFTDITDSELTGLSVSSSDKQYIEITESSITNAKVYEFLNSKGKKGLIKVTEGTLNNTNGSISVEVKVQR